MRLNRISAPTGFTLVDFLVIVAVLAILIAVLLSSLAGSKRHRPGLRCSNNLKQVGLAYRQWALDNNDKFPTQVSVTNGGAMEVVMAGNVAAVFQVMSNELSTPKILVCPEDERRIQATTFSKLDTSNRAFQGVYFSNNSNVSYFVGLDATETSPSMFLSGDDNWLVGGEARNVAYNGVPVTSGILSLWNKTPVAWSEARHKKQGNVGLADGSVQMFSSGQLAQWFRNTGVATNRLAMP